MIVVWVEVLLAAPTLAPPPPLAAANQHLLSHVVHILHAHAIVQKQSE